MLKKKFTSLYKKSKDSDFASKVVRYISLTILLVAIIAGLTASRATKDIKVSWEVTLLGVIDSAFYYEISDSSQDLPQQDTVVKDKDSNGGRQKKTSEKKIKTPSKLKETKTGKTSKTAKAAEGAKRKK